jgi:light-regulated signal transduction histidine kinase (bacteriophytochrome)
MHQLFQNLIGNSLKFHKEGEPPLIQISCLLTPKENWEIKLRDNGIGFDIKHLNRILRPFQRLHSREKFKGSGMGLAICQKIILRHGGTLTAISSHEQGSTFIIILLDKQPAKEESESLY